MTAERLVAVLGAGSFGTALAHHIARNGFSVCLWARDEQLLQAIESERENSDCYTEPALLCNA